MCKLCTTMVSEHRVQVVVSQAAPPRMVWVHEYRYMMDEQHTGFLYLMIDGRAAHRDSERQCCWRSEKTKLTTPWHGSWFTKPDRGIFARFDCHGKKNHKFCDLGEDGHDGHHGVDYQGRAIHAIQTRSWLFDNGTATYLEAPR